MAHGRVRLEYPLDCGVADTSLLLDLLNRHIQNLLHVNDIDTINLGCVPAAAWLQNAFLALFT